MKILNSNSKNFDKNLDSFLLQRKKKVQSNSVSVTNIIKDVKNNGDKALLKYEKKFNKNNTIVPTPMQISKSIKLLDKKVKQAIDIAYNRIYKFHSLQKFKNISYIDKFKNKSKIKSTKINYKDDLKLANSVAKKFNIPSTHIESKQANSYNFQINSEIKNFKKIPGWKQVNATTLIQSTDKFISSTNTKVLIFSHL